VGFLDRYPEDTVVYSLIGLISIFLIYQAFSYNPANFLQDDSRTTEAWLSNYPTNLAINQNFSYDLIINSRLSGNSNWQIMISYDGIKMSESSLSVQANNRFTANLKGFSFTQAGRHKVEVEIFNPDFSYESYGSKYKPYYLFFNVGVA